VGPRDKVRGALRRAQEAWMILEVPGPNFERRVRTSFARQGLNATISATLRRRWVPDLRVTGAPPSWLIGRVPRFPGTSHKSHGTRS